MSHPQLHLFARVAAVPVGSGGGAWPLRRALVGQTVENKGKFWCSFEMWLLYVFGVAEREYKFSQQKVCPKYIL